MSPAKAMCVALAGSSQHQEYGRSGIRPIYIGGAGAIFWMCGSGAGGEMPIKYTEGPALGHRRLKDGGAFFYITDTRRKWSGFPPRAALRLATSLSMGSAVTCKAAARRR